MEECKRNLVVSEKNSNIGNVATATTGDEIPNLQLPEEIIEEILKRLPVKSLKRFSCVSKPWLSLISSPQFIKTHLKYYSHKNPRFIYTLQNSYYDLKHSSLNSLLAPQDATVLASDTDYPMKHPDLRARVVGSCNGVICLFLGVNHILFWNPSSRTSKKLPRLPKQPKSKNGPQYHMWGLGFHECHGDYKAVAICCVLNTRSGLFEMRTHIYSLNADSWKRIRAFNVGLLMDHSGKYTRGKFHFTVLPGMNSESRIISVDAMSGLMGTVEQPDYGEGVIGTYLGVLEGCICVICNHQQRGVADVWVMKEYAVKDSWTKLFSIPFCTGDPGTGFSPPLYSQPLIMLPNGEILLVFGMHFVIYNPKHNIFTRPRINNLPHGFSAAHLYVESLVSF